MGKRKEIEVEVQRDLWVTKKVFVEDETFVKTSEVAFEILKELGGNCMGVYLTLLKHRNTKNNRCFPSIELLKKETGLSRNTVNKCLGELYNHEYININSGYKGINSNYYFLKESFYKLFEEDYCQRNATRRKGKDCFTEKRETKQDKEIKELKAEIERLKNEHQNCSRKRNTSYLDTDDLY